jgi:type VI secretion system protein ImpA
MDGLEGFTDGLEVLHGLVERYWDSVHPQLDPDDNNDPTLRLNTIASLCDGATTLKWVREARLVDSKAMGKFTYRDVLVASGELPPPPGTEKVEQAVIDGAFADCDGGGLKATTVAVKRALERSRSLESMVDTNVGDSSALSLEPLSEMLAAMAKLLEKKLAERGLDEEEQPAGDAESATDTSNAESDGESVPAAVNGRKASAPMSLTGDISSREDVIRALDKVCEYYKRYEPSSPVPLFLNRAKRLASKSFLEILRDLTPDALNQALALGGISDAGGSASGVDSNDV